MKKFRDIGLSKARLIERRAEEKADDYTRITLVTKDGNNEGFYVYPERKMIKWIDLKGGLWQFRTGLLLR